MFFVHLFIYLFNILKLYMIDRVKTVVHKMALV